MAEPDLPSNNFQRNQFLFGSSRFPGRDPPPHPSPSTPPHPPLPPLGSLCVVCFQTTTREEELFQINSNPKEVIDGCAKLSSSVSSSPPSLFPHSLPSLLLSPTGTAARARLWASTHTRIHTQTCCLGRLIDY